MAQRRMFSKSISNSSQFLMMPSSSQNLYFHLGMNADDDGFCEHFSIMRMTDSKPDDLKILQAKGFVNIFDDRVLVITDWKENNYLRADRYTPSKYLDIYKDEIKRLPSGIPTVATGKDRIGKESINKIEELPIWLNKKAWEAWEQHRKEKKKTLTPTSKKLQLRFLEENKENHAQIIKNSITNGWTGLFPIKGEFKKVTPSRYIEPNTSKEDNDRRNTLIKQSEELASKFKV